MKKLMLGVWCFAVGAATAARATVSSYDYVHDGLVGYWDGRENVARGQHSDNLTEWIDLINGHPITLHNTTTEVDRVVFAGTSDSYGILDSMATLNTFGSASGEDGRCTVEFVYHRESGSIALVQAPTVYGIMIVQLGNQICFSQQASYLMEYPTDVQSLTNTLTAIYANSNPKQPYYLNADEMTSSSETNYLNGNDDKTTLFGKRSNNNALLNGSIYAIRVYNRVLTSEEIAHNRAIDVQRFIDYVEPEANPEPEIVYFPNPSDNSNLSATVTYFVKAGAGCDTAEVKLVYGRTPTELTKTTILADAAPDSTENRILLTGLVPNTTYYAKLVVQNANGFVVESEVKSFATGPLREDQLGNGRSIWIASTNQTAGAVTSLDLAFATEDLFGYADLYAIYGSIAGGNTTDSWEHVELVTTIAPDTTSYRYAVPAGFGSTFRAIRFALFSQVKTSDQCDDWTEYVESTPGQTTIDTGIRGKVAEDYWIDVEADIDIISYPNDGGCLSCRSNGRCYLIYSYNGWCLGTGGYTCSGSALLHTGRQKVQIYYHPGTQWIKVDDAQVVSRNTASNDTGATLQLFQNWDIKLYSLNIYTNDIPARQYVGCRKDGMGGIYDTVSKTAICMEGFKVPDESVAFTFDSLSPTYYCTDSEVPTVSSVATVNLTAHSFDAAGMLSSFGGNREDCRVSLFLGFGGQDGEFAQHGETIVPEADGSFNFSVTGMRGATDICWYAEIVSGTGEKVRTTTISLTTPSVSEIKAKLTKISQSQVQYSCTLVKEGASATDFILFAAPDGQPLVPRAHAIGDTRDHVYTVTWNAFQDGDCDRNAPWRWEIRGVTAYEDEAWTNVVAGESVFFLRDECEYIWTGGGAADAEGWRDWFDAANWTTSAANEDKAGYPCSQYGLAKFTAGGDVKVRIDALERLHKLTVEAENLKLHIRGKDSGRSKLLMNADYWGEANGDTGRLVVLSVKGADTEVVISDFEIDLAMSIGIDNGATLVLDNCALVHNGLTFVAPWYLNAAAGSDYGGGRFELRNGSNMRQTNDAWYGPLCLAAGGEFVLDNSSFAGYVRFDFHLGGGKVRVAGENAKLYNSYFYTHQVPSETVVIPGFGTGMLEFAIPANGFNDAPPVRLYGYDANLALTIAPAKDSPIVGTGAKLAQHPLIAAGSLPKDKLEFGSVAKIESVFLYGANSSAPCDFRPVAEFPEETAAKSIGIDLAAPRTSFVIVVR